MSLKNAKLEIISISNVIDEAVSKISIFKSTIKIKNIELDKAKSEIVSLKLEKSTMKDNFEKIYNGKLI